MTSDHPDSRPRRPRRGALLAAACALTLGGVACADDGPDDARADTESIDPESAEGGGGGAADAASADEGQGDDPPDVGDGEVLGSSRTQLRATVIDPTPIPLRADVTRMERHDELVELMVTITNENPEDDGGPTFEPYDLFSDRADEIRIWDDASGLGLVDAEGQKLYLAAHDSEGSCLCTSGLAGITAPSGEAIVLTATIGGVPEDLEQVDVVVPHFPTITELTLP